MSGMAFAHGISDEARQRMIDGGDLQYLLLGAEHMLTGYDHLLFLFGVMFFLTRFVSILKFVTAFTLGHTITLIAATYLEISANYYLVDAVIAITVIYKGFENIDGFRKYLNMASPNLLAAVFTFGLIHGFGLSTRLQQLPIREDSNLLMHILSFNLGVELGQIIALIIMGTILNVWRRSPRFEFASGFANGCLMAAGVLLLAMQLHGYSHSAFAEDFRISRDDHAHVHDEMIAGEKAHSHNPDGSHPLGVPDHGPNATGADTHTHNPDGSHPPGVPDHAPNTASEQDTIDEDSGVEVPEHI
jgi:hypothetical protein